MRSNNELCIDNAITTYDKEGFIKDNSKIFTSSEPIAFSMNGHSCMRRSFGGNQLKPERKERTRNWSRCTMTKKRNIDENEIDEMIINSNTNHQEIKTCRMNSIMLSPPQFPDTQSDTSQFRIEVPGKLADQYQILEFIGEGGYGEVRKVRNKITKEIRAVKIIAKSKSQTTSDFSDETSILQKLAIKVLRVGSSECCKALWVL